MLNLTVNYGDRIDTIDCDRFDLDALYAHFDNEFAGGVGSPWQIYAFTDSPELKRIRHSDQLRDGMRILLVHSTDGHRSANTRPHMLTNKVFDKGDRSVCAFCNTVINPSQHTPLVALYCSACRQALHRPCVYRPACKCPAATRAAVFTVPHRFALGQFPPTVGCQVCCELQPGAQTTKCQECDLFCHMGCQPWSPSCAPGGMYRSPGGGIPSSLQGTSPSSDTRPAPKPRPERGVKLLSVRGHSLYLASDDAQATCGSCATTMTGDMGYRCKDCGLSFHEDCIGGSTLSMCSARAPERPAAAPPVDDTLEDLPIIRRGRYKYAVVMPGKSYAQDLCDVELTVAMLRLVFRAPDGRFSAIELPTPTLVKQWPSEGTYIALASPVFPSSTVVHIAAHPVDLNENAFMNYILEQTMTYARIRQRYIFKEDDEHFLNKGSFGSVYRAFDSLTDSRVAVKVINMTDLKERDQKRVGTELTLLQNQNHPGLMLIREACILAVSGLWAKAYLLMDFAAGGDLLDRVLNQPDKRLCERESRFYLYQILLAVEYLHDRKIAHRDLKLDNVLLMENAPFTRARVADFGYSRVVGEDLFMQTMVGTPEYMAPEVVNESLRQGGKLGYRLAADLWSVGVCAFVCLTGRFPFSRSVPIEERRPDPLVFFTAIEGSLEAKKFVLQCMNQDEVQRYTARRALQDPWFRKAPHAAQEVEEVLGELYAGTDLSAQMERL